MGLEIITLQTEAFCKNQQTAKQGHYFLPFNQSDWLNEYPHEGKNKDGVCETMTTYWQCHHGVGQESTFWNWAKTGNAVIAIHKGQQTHHTNSSTFYENQNAALRKNCIDEWDHNGSRDISGSSKEFLAKVIEKVNNDNSRPTCEYVRIAWEDKSDDAHAACLVFNWGDKRISYLDVNLGCLTLYPPAECANVFQDWWKKYAQTYYQTDYKCWTATYYCHRLPNRGTYQFQMYNI